MVLQDGQHFDGDILIGADGIWSEVIYSILDSLAFNLLTLKFALDIAFGFESLFVYLLRCVQSSWENKKQATLASHATVD